MQQAWGNVTVHTLPSYVGSDRHFVFDNAATPDGQWLIGTNQPTAFPITGGSPSYAVLYNVDTQQMVSMQQLQTPQSQIIAASADVDWVVWAEADDQPNFFDWIMFAYNRHTGQVERLGQAEKGANGQAVPGPFAGPVIDHDHVLWSETIGPVSSQNLSNSVVKLEDLTSGATTTLATSAGEVDLCWPWVTWAQAGPNSTGWQQFRNLVTGQTARLDDEASYLALSGTSIAYIDNNATLYQITDITQGTSNPQMLWNAPLYGYLDFVTMNQRLIGWNQNSAAIA